MFSQYLIRLARGSGGKPLVRIVALLPIVILALAMFPILALAVPIAPARYEKVVNATLAALCLWTYAVIAEPSGQWNH